MDARTSTSELLEIAGTSRLAVAVQDDRWRIGCAPASTRRGIDPAKPGHQVQPVCLTYCSSATKLNGGSVTLIVCPDEVILPDRDPILTELLFSLLSEIVFSYSTVSPIDGSVPAGNAIWIDTLRLLELLSSALQLLPDLNAAP